MKAISEMSLTELQDAYLQLAEEKNGLSAKLDEQTSAYAELQGLNMALQKRNNELFARVSMGVVPETNPEEREELRIESCEEFAKSNFKGVMKV